MPRSIHSLAGNAQLSNTCITSSSSRCICALFLLNSLTSFSSDCISLTFNKFLQNLSSGNYLQTRLISIEGWMRYVPHLSSLLEILEVGESAVSTHQPKNMNSKHLMYNLQGFWNFARWQSREIQVYPQNPAKLTKTREIPRNSLEILPNTCRYVTYLKLILATGAVYLP